MSLYRTNTGRLLTRLLSATALITAVVLAVTKSAGGVEVVPDSPADIVAYQSGEELWYDVSFLSIKLGTVHIKIDGASTRDGKPVWHGYCYADSRQGIPFVSLHVVYESFMDEVGGYSHEFLGSEKMSDGSWKYSKYLFNYPQNKITVENGSGSQVWKKFEIASSNKWCDGLSLFFYARRNAMYKKTVSVPSIVQDDTARTVINFLGEQESQEIEAVNYPVNCNHFKGTANWTGVYGMTGKFEGWFSNDRASVPIRAQIKLMVGSAWLELTKWNRPGWSPPRGS